MCDVTIVPQDGLERLFVENARYRVSLYLNFYLKFKEKKLKTAKLGNGQCNAGRQTGFRFYFLKRTEKNIFFSSVWSTLPFFVAETVNRSAVSAVATVSFLFLFPRVRASV